MIMLPLPDFFKKTPGYRQRRRCRGWTLPEILVSGATAAILATLAVPSFSDWRQRAAETTAFNLIGHAASYARIRAVRDHRYTTVCASEQGSACDGQWHQHIIVFNDDNRNETLDDDERLLRRFDLPDDLPCVVLKASARRDYLQFKPNGSSNGTAGHFRLCDNDATPHPRRLVVSLNGRTTLREF